ncbi:Hypothetical_protein [Hexamita inflata]|uniref:Hypothetical_protein n=1 Tax=Hexamita inflata TaxID=28002 RepID=A0AA86NL84_9EUKA|nr:Hypothetical protein HINF_LOCUS8809 [Hexamita inflata]
MSQNQLLQLKVNALLQKELQKIFNARKTGEDETASIQELNPSEEAKEPKSVQIIQQLSERNKQYIVQYVKEHNALSTAQIIFYLAKHFQNKHGIAKSAVQQFVLRFSKSLKYYGVRLSQLFDPRKPISSLLQQVCISAIIPPTRELLCSTYIA